MKYKIYAFIILVISGMVSSNAQQSVMATGGNATGNGGSISYSIGQVAYTVSKGTTGSISAGVQQSYEILVLTDLDRAKIIELECRTYPNPVTSNLVLVIEGDKPCYNASLCDVNGKLVSLTSVKENETNIQMDSLAKGIYILKINDQHNKLIKIFRIVKN